MNYILSLMIGLALVLAPFSGGVNTSAAATSSPYLPNPGNCASPGTFINYVANCGAELSVTDPSPWTQLSPAWIGSLRINTEYPTNWGKNDFAFSDGTMNSAAQTLGFGQCVNISGVAALAPGTLVTFGGYYRTKFDPIRVTSVYTQMTAFTDTACTSGAKVMGTGVPLNKFDFAYHPVYVSAVVPASTQSILLQVMQTYSADPAIPDSTFWDNFLFYPGISMETLFLPVLRK